LLAVASSKKAFGGYCRGKARKEGRSETHLNLRKRTRRRKDDVLKLFATGSHSIRTRSTAESFDGKEGSGTNLDIPVSDVDLFVKVTKTEKELVDNELGW
jgi:hypothetical protein